MFLRGARRAGRGRPRGVRVSAASRRAAGAHVSGSTTRTPSYGTRVPARRCAPRGVGPGHQPLRLRGLDAAVLEEVHAAEVQQRARRALIEAVPARASAAVSACDRSGAAATTPSDPTVRPVRLIEATHMMKVMSTNLTPTRRLIRATKFSLYAYAHASPSRAAQPARRPSRGFAGPAAASASPTIITVDPIVRVRAARSSSLPTPRALPLPPEHRCGQRVSRAPDMKS